MMISIAALFGGPKPPDSAFPGDGIESAPIA
jgi:hypothetical protein